MRTDHMNSAPTLPTIVSKCLFFFLFFPLTLWLYLRQLPYLEMRTDHVNTTPMLSITVYIMSILFFSFFSDFLAIFALLTIFGNVHRPCKQHPNIVNNSLPHVCSFFPILGNAHRPCKQFSNITTPSLFFFWIFSYFFFIWNYKIYHVWQFLVFIPVTGFQCHSVPVNSGDCSSEITGIPQLPEARWPFSATLFGQLSIGKHSQRMWH